MRRVSPAMAVSCIALTVALSGTGYAALQIPRNSVGSKQLKKNSVTAPKLKRNAVTAAKLKAGAVTPAKVAPETIALFKGQKGDTGAQGPAGTQGTRGPQGPPGITTVISRQAEAIGTAKATAVASCQPGEQLIGGGGISSSGVLTESESDAKPDATPRAWRVTGIGSDTEEVWVVAEALCAS
jgi:hypothetical protein